MATKKKAKTTTKKKKTSTAKVAVRKKTVGKKVAAKKKSAVKAKAAPGKKRIVGRAPAPMPKPAAPAIPPGTERIGITYAAAATNSRSWAYVIVVTTHNVMPKGRTTNNVVEVPKSHE